MTEDRNAFDGDDTVVEAKVKWFNPVKGFGFVTLEDGSQDAFLHVSVVQGAGYAELGQGTIVRCVVGQGPKGRQVRSIEHVQLPDDGFAPSLDSIQEQRGTVKFYNPDKGFGFITPDAGGPDVYVAAATIVRSGIAVLETGQRVRMRTRAGRKGPLAETVTVD